MTTITSPVEEIAVEEFNRLFSSSIDQSPLRLDGTFSCAGKDGSEALAYFSVLTGPNKEQLYWINPPYKKAPDYGIFSEDPIHALRWGHKVRVIGVQVVARHTQDLNIDAHFLHNVTINKAYAYR